MYTDKEICIYVGDNRPSCSLSVMAQDIRNACGWNVITKVSHASDYKAVINLVLTAIPKFVELKRFCGLRTIATVFAGNTEELLKPDLLGLLAYMDRTKVIVHSKYHYMKMLEALRSFNPMYARELRNNLHLVHGGITSEFFNTEGKNDKNIWMCPFNRINRTQKNINLHAEITSELLLAAPDATCNFYRFDFERELKFGCYKEYPVPENREDYVKNCAMSGMFLCVSNFESLGLMYLELLASGCVGVFLDKPWVRTLLPTYPIIFPKSDLATNALAVYKNWDYWHENLVRNTIPWIKEHRSHDNFVKGIKEFV